MLVDREISETIIFQAHKTNLNFYRSVSDLVVEMVDFLRNIDCSAFEVKRSKITSKINFYDHHRTYGQDIVNKIIGDQS